MYIIYSYLIYLKGWKGVAYMWAEFFSSVKMAEQKTSTTLGKIE